MGKRKKLSEVEIAQYSQPSSNKRHAGTVHYVQNDGGSGALHQATSHHHQQQQQQQQQHQQLSTTTQGGTTYYQIQQQTTKSSATVQHHQPQQQQHQVIRTVSAVATGTTTSSSTTTASAAAATTTTQEYRCIKCQHLFLSKETFLEHCNQYHYFACDLCTNCLFNDLVQLNVHMIKHINKNDMCEKCHLVCNSPEELKVHLGNHITTYNRDDVIFTTTNSSGQQEVLSNESPTVTTTQSTVSSNGSVPLASVLNDDSLIEQLASELDQSIGKTAKIKPQKYRCGVCKQDFSDPRLLFKHMNLVHINFPLQQQVHAEQQPPPQPSPPPPPVTQQQTENVVYTSLSPDNIYYDERTGQYYTIALMDHSPPLHESGGGQSVIGYVQDSSLHPDPSIEYVDEPTTETIVVEDEPPPPQHHQQKIIQSAPATTIVQHQSIIQTAPSSRTHAISNTTTSVVARQQQQQQQQQQSLTHQSTVADAQQQQQQQQQQQLVHITRETDLEELIPTTTLAVAGESEVSAPTAHAKSSSKDTARQTPNQKCVSCGIMFVKKFPKQMYCHACVARNTSAALGKH